MKLATLLAMMLVGGAVSAQEHHKQHGHSPYVGSEKRSLKALTDQQIADLRAGRGMGLALAAELNGYPGPLHVLELADRLELSAEQRGKIQGLYSLMQAEAVLVGAQLLEHETALDRLFKDRAITPEALSRTTGLIGETQGMLRSVHLKYHLTTAAALTPEQIRRYAELRGYH